MSDGVLWWGFLFLPGGKSSDTFFVSVPNSNDVRLPIMSRSGSYEDIRTQMHRDVDRMLDAVQGIQT